MNNSVVAALIGAIGAIGASVIGVIGVIIAAIISRPDRKDGQPRREPTPRNRVPSWVGRVRRGVRPRRPTWPGWTRKTKIATALVAFVALGVGGVWGLLVNLPKACTSRTSLTITVSAEKDLLLKDLADEYDDTGRTCSDISVIELTSGAALNDLINGGFSSHVWMPSSSMWVDLLRAHPEAVSKPVGAVESVAQSPLVIAMPDKVASAFGWNQRTFGWREVLGYARDPDSWDQIREKNPGLTQSFFLAKENPEKSTSAFAATVASYYAAASQYHEPGKLTAQDINDRRITNDVRNVESSLQYRLDDIMDLLKNLGEEDLEGQASSHLSGVIMQEELSYLYNSGDPEVFEQAPTSPRKEPLRVFYPQDGTIVMDHPYVMLSSLRPAQKEIARDFGDYLRESAQQDRFREKGFRGHDGRMFSEQIAQQAGLPTERNPSFLEKPDTEALQAIYENVGSLRRSTRVLLLVDRSGSMGDRGGEFKSGLEIVKEQLHDKLIDQLGDNDELTVWSFAETYRQDVPPTRGNVLKSDKGKQEFDEQIAAIAFGGNTALHDTVLAAVSALRAESSNPDGLTPTIIVLSDGYDTQDTLSLNQLQQRLEAEGEETPVPRIYTIGYGVTDPNRDKLANALKDISIATNGNFYDAKKDAVDLDRVFIEVFGHL